MLRSHRRTAWALVSLPRASRRRPGRRHAHGVGTRGPNRALDVARRRPRAHRQQDLRDTAGVRRVAEVLRHRGAVPAIPAAAVGYVAHQLGIDPSELAGYVWSGRTIEYHRAQIRQALGFQQTTEDDEARLAQWLAERREGSRRPRADVRDMEGSSRAGAGRPGDDRAAHARRGREVDIGPLLLSGSSGSQDATSPVTAGAGPRRRSPAIALTRSSAACSSTTRSLRVAPMGRP